jgi:hypothetical protein
VTQKWQFRWVPNDYGQPSRWYDYKKKGEHEFDPDPGMELKWRQIDVFEPGWFWNTTDSNGNPRPVSERTIEYFTFDPTEKYRAYGYERVTELPDV